MSGYSDYEIPLDYSIVITSSSFKRIKKLGDLHQRILRIVFSIDTNSLVPLLWCVSFKINIPEINRNTEFISSFDRLTVPIDDRESSFFAFTILSYVKELTIDKGTYIGEVFTRSDGNMRSFAITTPSVVSINALLNSLNLPEAPNQQQSVIPESSGPQGTITSSESGPQGPTTSSESGPQGPTTSSESGPQGPTTSSESGPQGTITSSESGPQGPTTSSESGPQGPTTSSESGPQGPTTSSES
ncbi:hypothetical protein HMI56_000319, partial [Coelomomyces lativittatus]